MQYLKKCTQKLTQDRFSFRVSQQFELDCEKVNLFQDLFIFV